ncbi:MAG: DUF1501 domain-containing protein [Saprospirales bacterium]|nr:MAG: DUF1501 domain-containing protein [Saprospirales bacterium]
MKNHHRTKDGLSLDNKKAHESDHLSWSRRGFLQSVGLTTSMSLLLGKLPLRAFTSSAMDYVGETDRVLILIRLAGGNDGLNTVVPLFDYGRYQQLRTTVAIPPGELTELKNGLAMPQLTPDFFNLWNNDLMKIVQGVGYPEQNLSHFRSTDIWSTASDAQFIEPSGWLGRLITLDDPEITIHPPEHPAAVQIGNSGNLTFNNSDNVNLSFQVSNTNQLFQIVNEGKFFPVEDLPECLHGSQIEFVRNLANQTFRYADVIKMAYEKAENSLEYTASSLANQLAIVARLIKGGLRTSLYMVTLDGFDTHANQPNQHMNLLRALSSNVKEFFADLKTSDNDKRVLAMTTSEFGRRPQQNASNGTDHGAAAPLFVFGPEVNGADIIGQHPDLNDLDMAGNLKFGIDFRQVYRTILTDWLCFPDTDTDDILGRDFEALDLGFNCSTTRIVDHAAAISEIGMITHHLRHFTFTIDAVQSVYSKVKVYDLQGREVVRLYRGILNSGLNKFDLHTSDYNMAAGMYIFTVKAGSRLITRKFVVV